MVRITAINPLARSVTVIGAVAALATGVTFAALQSQATLTNNTISSASAVLLVDNTGDPARGLTPSDNGFAFTGMVPGGAASNTGTFQLKNDGSTALHTHVKVPTLPTYVDSNGNDVTVDNTKVFVVFKNGAGADQSFALSALNGADGVQLADDLAAGAVANYTVKVTMDVDAFTANQAVSTNFDFLFTGKGF